MNKLLPLLITVSLGAAIAFPLHAQSAASGGNDPIATLKVKQGDIMHSTGGEFVGAPTGTRLIDGERIMVTEGATAVVVWDNECRREYDEPGVYEIDESCVAAGYISNADMMTIVAVSGVLFPLLWNGESQDPEPPPPPPVSK